MWQDCLDWHGCYSLGGAQFHILCILGSLELPRHAMKMNISNPDWSESIKQQENGPATSTTNGTHPQQFPSTISATETRAVEIDNLLGKMQGSCRIKLLTAGWLDSKGKGHLGKTRALLPRLPDEALEPELKTQREVLHQTTAFRSHHKSTIWLWQ